MKTGIRIALLVALLGASLSQSNAQVTFSASGANASAIQSTVDAFRTSLGSLNPNNAGSAANGRREINWDGVPNTLAAPNNLPANFFNVNSPRGAVFSGAGAFQVSANAGVAPIQFDNLNPTYSSEFEPFSPQRLFSPLGSTVTDVNFFVPGSSTPALTDGFGAVFSDVDVANASTIQFFDKNGASLGIFSVPNSAGDQTFSFLGVEFGAPVISRVRITSGNTALGVSESGAADLVVMDDFIYGEPQSAPDASNTLPLLATSLGALIILRFFMAATKP